MKNEWCVGDVRYSLLPDDYYYRYVVSTNGEVFKVLPDETLKKLNMCVHNRLARVTLRKKNGDRREKGVAILVAQQFMQGQREGYLIYHRNHFKLDCSLENLEYLPVNQIGKRHKCRKPVAKLDAYGRTVEVYSSIGEAASKNFYSTSQMSRLCKRRRPSDYKRNGCYFKLDL